MITLLAAAMRKQKNDRCRDYVIVIKGAEKNLFVDRKDVIKLLTAGTNGKIKGQPMASFKLRQLEQLLEKNVWIKDAELYFDNKDVLRVTIAEREPVARVFTTTGRTFYIDKEEKQMPLSDKMSAQVPVFTGFPNKKLLTARDSMLLTAVRTTAEFISNDPFWMAQVSQIDITSEREFEMVPVVGNHLVKLGNGENIERKFHRLFVFYKNILSKTGFDKYSVIDVQYAGQVIGVKGNVSKVDSLQLKNNVEKLLQQSRDMQYDTMALRAPVIEKPGIEASTVTTTETNTPTSTLSRDVNPNPMKLSESKPVERNQQDPKPVTATRQPRAVMPARQ